LLLRSSFSSAVISSCRFFLRRLRKTEIMDYVSSDRILETLSKKSVELWTKVDTQYWFRRQGVAELTDHCQMNGLMCLQVAKSEAYRGKVKSYLKQFLNDDVRSFVAFDIAIEELHKWYDLQQLIKPVNSFTSDLIAKDSGKRKRDKQESSDVDDAQTSLINSRSSSSNSSSSSSANGKGTAKKVPSAGVSSNDEISTSIASTVKKLRKD